MDGSMPELHTCPSGHKWEGDGACPHCGMSREGVEATLPSPAQTFSTTGPGGPGPLPDLPGYELLRELGRGGMGVVYLARQVKLNRLTAVKMILSGPHADALVRQRFQIE